LQSPKNKDLRTPDGVHKPHRAKSAPISFHIFCHNRSAARSLAPDVAFIFFIQRILGLAVVMVAIAVAMAM
jgi:hypothetical protein